MERTSRHTNISIEQAIVAIATHQHGVVTRAQLLGAGVTGDAVDRRIKTGRLRRVFQGVYQTSAIGAPQGRDMAAVLACGQDAALSHWSAAVCWQTLRAREDDVHVLASGRRPVSRPGLRVHFQRTICPDEVTARDHIPITTPARTLFDLAGCATQRELEQALAESFALRLVTKSEAAVLVDRYVHCRGVRRLRNLLERDARPALTRSQAEEKFLTLIRKAQLREPDINVALHGYEVDFLWRDERLVVEIDGRAFHSSDRAFESDRRRDAVLLGSGMRVMRVTWKQILSEPEALLARVVRALTVAPG